MTFESTVVSRLGKRFRAASGGDAVAMKAYMRDQFEFFGIKRAPREAIVREAIVGLEKPTESDLIALARACWKKPEREWQYAALGLLRKHVRRLSASFLPVARELITQKSWWDTVDEIAQNLVGPVVSSAPELKSEMDRWAHDENLWVARTAILHQNKYRDRTDHERLFAYCAHNAANKDFFMRKAIGWALRVYADTAPKAVKRFVETHELSPLSVKEAMRGVERATISRQRPSPARKH